MSSNQNTTMSTTFSRPMNHVAVSVNDIEAVTAWYTEVMGFQLIGNRIFHIKRSETPSAAIFSIYGDALHEVKLAYMATGNGVGFEVFEFINLDFKANAVSFEYNRGGFFHICVTDPNPDALADKIVQSGGMRQGTTVKVAGGAAICAYIKDPWGNVVEILDSRFDRMATMDVAQ
ncbi:Glyoxalase/Bleomycin resistance protein/Dihydroxybiphenyl dioxygenase [Penicillium brevicompactum]|uniref:Glyoxalase/Bleomycin resistance protein/Dihydroxybiphenyl dioxygenase n=1 Tax=Penicillium brevicompactum TaxID=5074 RepID=A0A9W9QU13_PENBR|nr:Glyoxalase/Bleomycin resistance protein/Dihydroxybiphenyl dioxygenase [Penicillium brevicompactum]